MGKTSYFIFLLAVFLFAATVSRQATADIIDRALPDESRALYLRKLSPTEETLILHRAESIQTLRKTLSNGRVSSASKALTLFGMPKDLRGGKSITQIFVEIIVSEHPENAIFDPDIWVSILERVPGRMIEAIEEAQHTRYDPQKGRLMLKRGKRGRLRPLTSHQNDALSRAIPQIEAIAESLFSRNVRGLRSTMRWNREGYEEFLQIVFYVVAKALSDGVIQENELTQFSVLDFQIPNLMIDELSKKKYLDRSATKTENEAGGNRRRGHRPGDIAKPKLCGDCIQRRSNDDRSYGEMLDALINPQFVIIRSQSTLEGTFPESGMLWETKESEIRFFVLECRALYDELLVLPGGDFLKDILADTIEGYVERFPGSSLEWYRIYRNDKRERSPIKNFPKRFRDRFLALKVFELYHIRGLSMESISRVIGSSKPELSELLAELEPEFTHGFSRKLVNSMQACALSLLSIAQ